MNILFGIVTFREDYKDSPLFQLLLNKKIVSTEKEGVSFSVFVYDNTDIEGWCVDLSKNENYSSNVYYEHDLKNSGISKAYNRIAGYAKDNGFDYVIFLDQDTQLPNYFLDQYIQLIKENVKIACPLIYSNNILISPSKYINYRSYTYNDLLENKLKLKGNTCINSGLLVRVDFFHEVGSYNESLRLDFCDHEFIARVNNFTNYIRIVKLKLEQDFSTNTNSKEKALFRYVLFLKDLKSFKNINNNDWKILIFVDFPHLLRLTFQYKNFKFLQHRFLNY